MSRKHPRVDQEDGKLPFDFVSSYQLATSVAADITLRVGIDGEQPTDIPFARFPLAAQSPVFSRMLYGSMAEAKVGAVIDVAFPLQAVQAFLDAVCCGNITITLSTASDLYRMADFYQVEPLKKVAANYILEHLDMDTAAVFLTSSEEGNLRTAVLDFMQRYTRECLAGPRVAKLSQTVFVELLQSRFLNISEVELFHAVVRWGKTLSGGDTSSCMKAKVAPLMEHLRFPLMQFDELANEVEPTGLVRKELIYEAFLGKSKRIAPADVRFQKRGAIIILNAIEPAGGINHGDVAEADRNGLFYYLGTQGGAREYINPCQAGIVSVSWSSCSDGKEHFFAGLQHGLQSSFTMPRPDSWMQMDLGEQYVFVPRRYALRDGSTMPRPSNNNHLRNWNLEARCNDSDDFTVLSSHSNDDTFRDKFVASWPIPSNCGAFRFFRIRQTGLNSSAQDYLLCSGFELWGDLYWSTPHA